MTKIRTAAVAISTLAALPGFALSVGRILVSG
jgi:hypothetical protein